jgi:biotin transport system substrate-specific component
VNETATRFQLPVIDATATRFAVSLAMSGVLMLTGLLSFPVPWTPVPFSMLPFGLLLAGAVQRPAWGVLSVLIYLVAGGLGAHVFAQGANGWEHFIGATAGYLFGFPVVAYLVGKYARRPRLLPGWLRSGLIAVFATSAVAGIAVIAWMWDQGGVRTDQGDYGITTAVLWALAWVTTAAIAMAVWNLRGDRSSHALDAWIVMMGALLLLHAMGVTGLWLLGDLPLIEAIALGSIVFLPFDTVKAGLAVALTVPFLSSPSREPEHA